MVFKKKEPEPVPPKPVEKEEAYVFAFTAHIALNGWVVQQQYTDGVVEEFVFVGKTSYDELGAYLFPNLAPKLPVVEEKKVATLPVEDEMRLTKEEIVILENLQKKAGMKYDPRKDAPSSEDEPL